MEFSMRKVSGLFNKEIKDIGKNKNILLMCLLPILYSFAYNKIFASQDVSDGVDKIEILIMCVGMNVVLVSGFVIAMLIAEEKEKNTLRTLMLSGVSPLEFLTGKVFITVGISEVINVVMFFIIGMKPQYLIKYILVSSILVLIMIGIGSIIGMIAPSQMSTGVIGMPVMMIFLLLPMFARFNEGLRKAAKFVPNHHMNLIIEKIFRGEVIGAGSGNSIVVMVVWLIITVVSFIYIYNKVGLDK